MPTHPPIVDPKAEAVFRVFLLNPLKLLWRPKLISERPFPEEACFVYGNHSNNYDPFVYNMFTRFGASTLGVLTQERMRRGFIARLLRGIGLEATRKWVPEPHLIRAIFRMLDQNRSVVVFPEGGRRWDGTPIPWIPATAKLFVRAGRPIYPVITHGSYVAWPRWATWPRPARIQVEVKEPFQFGKKANVDEAIAQLKAVVDFDESRPPEAVRPRWAYRPADGIHRLLYRDPHTGDYGAVHTSDGTTVQSRTSTLRYHMQPDSLLVDAHGEEATTAELYAQVKAMPLQQHPDGAYLRQRVEAAFEEQFPDLIPRGSVEAVLYPDRLRLHGATVEDVPLESIRFTGIERSTILELTLDTGMWQLTFSQGGSVLAWEDALRKLAVGQHAAPATS
ncbi:MAG: lysophospholipid acyltransferase family protein [Bacteroidota bacterium]